MTYCYQCGGDDGTHYPSCQTLGKTYPEGAYTPIVHASDVAVMRTCLRKWHGVLVQGHREGDSEATARGTAIHAILEHYLDTGEPIDTTTHYGRIAASGLKYLPPVQSGVTEQHFRLFGPIVDGEPAFAYYGAIDWISKEERRIKDHKTTSNFKYQKTEETLRLDPQVIVYGSYCAETRPGTDIEFEWIYYLTAEKSTRKALSTRFVMTEADLAEAKADLDQEILRSIEYRKLPMAALPPTPKSCFMYGKPCHLKSKCLDVKPTIGDLMSSTKDAMLANLKAKGLGAVAPPGVPMPPTPGAVTPPAAPGLPTLPVIGAPAATAAPSLPALPVIGKPAAPPGLPVLPVIGSPAAPALPSLGAPPAIDPAIMALAAAEGKAKAPPPVTPPAIAPITPPIASPLKEPSAVKPVTGQPIGTLYVDCLPLGEAMTPFSTIAAQCHQGIKETMNLAHYRLAQFGTGPAVWSSAVAMYVAAMPCDSLYLDTTANDGRDALEVLLPMAARVIRGIK